MSILPVLTAGCVLPPAVAAARRRSSAAVLLLLAMSLVVLGVTGLASSAIDWSAGWILIAAVPVLSAVAWLPESRSGVAWVLRFGRHHRLLRGITVSVCTVVILVGGTEWAVYVLVKTGVVELTPPIRIIGRGTEDWRQTILLTSTVREPDPVLLWRPRAVAPYNAQRFQGPLAAVPKPAGVFRIMCYGDSNTDGHAGDGGWPARLGRRLAAAGWPGGGVRAEVINAGVMGYSSYQGLRRFEEEVGTFTPDLVFVSFGWNDAPGALGKPDKSFALPPPSVVVVQRFLMGFRTVQLLQSVGGAAADAPVATVGPRVAIDDYVANLREFVAVGARQRVAVVLLTRPHRSSTGELSRAAGWRAKVVDYNRALVDFAAQAGVPVVDVRRQFEAMPQWFADECHFTAAGHDRMAGILTAALPRLTRR